MKQGKTKKISGIDLSSSSFAYVGNQDDKDSWQVPLFVPGDTSKTANLIKNAIHRFCEMKRVPKEVRGQVWQRVVGAALAHGIECDAKFEAKPESRDEVQAEVKVVELNEVGPVPTDEGLSEVLALADRRADEMLRMLGLE